MGSPTKMLFKSKTLSRFLFLFIMLACNNSQIQTENTTENLKFKINHQLLEDVPLMENGFSIFTPKGWTKLDSSNFIQLKNVIESEDNLIHLNLLGAYQSPKLATTIVSKLNNHGENFDFLPDNFLEVLKKQFATNNINVADININGLKVKQFIITNDTHTAFKLFVGGKQNYQVDYILPREIYEMELGKVESSIGTITKKGEKQ